MKILFLTLSGLTFNVTTPENEPLGGTESSFCYLARQLAQDGYDVTLSGRNVGTVTRMGVRHTPEVNLSDYDVVITNGPIRITEGKRPYHILWNHLAHTDQAIKALTVRDVMQGIDCIVYVSEWQKNQCEIQFGKCSRTEIIGNGLTPAFESMFKNAEELLAAKSDRAVYTSTPFRGLRLLPKIWEIVSPSHIPCDGGYGIIENDNATELEIYSSMQVYQHNDEGYNGIYQDLIATPNVHYIGSVSQSQLCDKLRRAAFMTYPCTFPETFCIAALEALAAGCHVVTTKLGALPSTCGGYADYLVMSEQTTEDNLIKDYAWIFGMAQEQFNLRPKEWAEMRFAGVQYANQFTWKIRAKEWISLLEQARATKESTN